MAFTRRKIHRSIAGIPDRIMNMIPINKYKEILGVLPILCADVVIQNTRGEYLLIKRANEPKKDQWWVIGGRVLKGETIEEAAIRKVKEETGLQIKKPRPIGYFELVFGENPFGLPFEYHSASVVFTVIIDDRQSIKLDSQSKDFKFAKKLPVDFQIRPFGINNRQT